MAGLIPPLHPLPNPIVVPPVSPPVCYRQLTHMPCRLRRSGKAVIEYIKSQSVSQSTTWQMGQISLSLALSRCVCVCVRSRGVDRPANLYIRAVWTAVCVCVCVMHSALGRESDGSRRVWRTCKTHTHKHTHTDRQTDRQHEGYKVWPRGWWADGKGSLFHSLPPPPPPPPSLIPYH